MEHPGDCCPSCVQDKEDGFDLSLNDGVCCCYGFYALDLGED